MQKWHYREGEIGRAIVHTLSEVPYPSLSANHVQPLKPPSPTAHPPSVGHRAEPLSLQSLPVTALHTPTHHSTAEEKSVWTPFTAPSAKVVSCNAQSVLCSHCAGSRIHQRDTLPSPLPLAVSQVHIAMHMGKHTRTQIHLHRLANVCFSTGSHSNTVSSVLALWLQWASQRGLAAFKAHSRTGTHVPTSTHTHTHAASVVWFLCNISAGLKGDLVSVSRGGEKSHAKKRDLYHCHLQVKHCKCSFVVCCFLDSHRKIERQSLLCVCYAYLLFMHD